MDKRIYADYKEYIKTGDLLVWGADKTASLVERVISYFIRLFTVSNFSHVGVALVLSTRLFVVEAKRTGVVITPLSDRDVFYHIPMNVPAEVQLEDFLISKVGCKYSFTGLFRGFFLNDADVTDDSYQCAELVNEVYKKCGIDLGGAYTPRKIVDTVMARSACGLRLVKKR